MSKPKQLDNMVVVSDLHCGCGLALCHPDGIELDDGGRYMPSRLQLKVYGYWREFWDEFVPHVTLGEDYCVVLNGEGMDGVHHGSVTQATHNIEFQRRHAETLMAPVVEACGGRYYHIRGTEAHSGQSSREDETLARNLGAIPNEIGQYARNELWKRIGGKRGGLIHAAHHIGTTGSTAYESSAVMREMAESFVEAGRWGDEPPRIIVRSHRHRNMEIRIPSKDGSSIGVVTPGWQLKTPFLYRLPGGRTAQPQIGGVVVRYHKDELYVRSFVRRIERPKEA